MMKQTILFAGLVLSALLTVSCIQEPEALVQKGTPIELVLVAPETRTVNDGMSTHWEKGDLISAVFAPAGTNAYDVAQLTITDPETGTASGYAELTAEAYDWYLAYPYISESAPVTTIPFGEEIISQDKYNNMSHLAGRNLPVYGVAKNVPKTAVPTVKMKNAAAVAAINLTNGTGRPIGVHKITLKAPCDIVGDFCFDFSKEEPTYTAVKDRTSDSCLLTIYNTDEIPAGGSARFYIPVKPFTLSAGDKLTLEIVGSDYWERIPITKESTASGDLSFKEGTLKTLNVTYDAKTMESMAYGPFMKLYYALDGPNWTKQDGWGTDAPIHTWAGVYYNVEAKEWKLSFSKMGLKGEIPECIDEIPNLSYLSIQDEPGVTGTLPASFANLTKLQTLVLEGTSMTSLPDLFGNMKGLEYVMLINNTEMTGPLPESLGSSEILKGLTVWWNAFTGTAPASWARHYKYMSLWANHLSGKIPQTYLEGEEVAYKLNCILNQQEGYGFDISDIDIPGYWPRGTVEDLNGKSFSFADVVAKNKYTVYLSWATWCPFSKALMPQLLNYYKKYRQDGLEIIATEMLPDGDNTDDWTGVLELQANEVREKGYDQWYNFYFEPLVGKMSYPASTPQAEVYDQKGNVVFSSFFKFQDPVRKRYGGIEGYAASVDLIPFLESVLGPAETPDPYTSTDYSKDGTVMTLQTASVGKGINVVFMGDGYTDKDMDSDGVYETLMRNAMEEFFAIEPYKSFRNRFNVYAVKVVSPNGRIGDGYSTALSTGFGNGSETYGNVDKAYEYAMKAPGIDSRDDLLVNVMVNTQRNAGTAIMSQSTQSSVTFSATFGNDPQYFGSVLRHECGHGFAFLADEYVSFQMRVPDGFAESNNLGYETYGWNANIDFTDDPSKVRWSAFLADERYVGKVGIFEGGSLYSLGVWRPSSNSMMRDNLEYFNAPSRLAIYKRIMQRSGETYSFEKFLEYDAVNRNSAAPASVRPPQKAPARFEEIPPLVLP